MIINLLLCDLTSIFALDFYICNIMVQTIFNTPQAELESLPRLERLIILRDSIQELIDEGTDLHETLENVEREIDIERQK